MTAPSAASRYAFFDVDDTLISVKSMFSFQDYWFQRVHQPEKRKAFDMEMRQLQDEQAPWEILNNRYYAHFADRHVGDVQKMGADWFAETERNTPSFYHTRVVERLRQLQREGTIPVLVSGSFPALLTPLARRLEIRHLLCCRLEEVEGRYTGRLIPPQTIGAGKARAIVDFLSERHIAPETCLAFGDDISDRPMLEAVGHPTVVEGGRGLCAHAATVGWPVMSPR